MRNARTVTLMLIVSLVAAILAPRPLAAAMPRLGRQTSDCRTSTVHILVKGVLVDYDCFGADGSLGMMNGTQMQISPSGERSSNGYSSTGGLSIGVSSAVGCRVHSGLTLSLKNRCLQLLESVNSNAAPIMSLRNVCHFRHGKAALPEIPCLVPADKTSGSITFTHWSTNQGARISFRFSPGATLTGFFGDTSAPHGIRTLAIPISGSATTTPID
ncbi:MAG: hypothetical protein ACYDGM_05420 [Vulcanimicrobiaceae bacterium]